jgi:hypothetical protein
MRISMARLDAAFAKARNDLAEVGLLSPGQYLDVIDCARSPLPTGWFGELGYVFEGDPGPFREWLGFRPGVIYIPMNAPMKLHVPGGTLADTIRHEFAHAWYWLDPGFVDAPWFRSTFGARYGTDPWCECCGPEFDPDAFVSEYACSQAKEDFAETFMWFLKYRRSLKRFRSRPIVYEKLMAVAEAVEVAARTRVGRRRTNLRAA